VSIAPEIRVITRSEKEIAKAEVAAYIDSLLREYTAKTVGLDKPPAWSWTLGWPLFYRPEDRRIYIPEHIYVLGYILEPYKTKRSLSWALAHEYWHYVQDVRGEWAMRIPILSFPRVAEYIAEKRAVLLSGIGDAEGIALTREILNRILSVVFFERKELWT